MYFAIFVMNADGSGEQQLTADDVKAAEGGWSPDGKKIGFVVFDCLECTTADIYTMTEDGNAFRNLTSSPDFHDFGTAWGPRVGGNQPGG